MNIMLLRIDRQGSNTEEVALKLVYFTIPIHLNQRPAITITNQ